jgi:hypothetical protein
VEETSSTPPPQARARASSSTSSPLLLMYTLRSTTSPMPSGRRYHSCPSFLHAFDDTQLVEIPSDATLTEVVWNRIISAFRCDAPGF